MIMISIIMYVSPNPPTHSSTHLNSAVLSTCNEFTMALHGLHNERDMQTTETQSLVSLDILVYRHAFLAPVVVQSQWQSRAFDTSQREEWSEIVSEQI